jgi:hypothetical protein
VAENTRVSTLPSSPNSVAANGYTNLENWLHLFLDDVEGRKGRIDSGVSTPIDSGATVTLY